MPIVINDYEYDTVTGVDLTVPNIVGKPRPIYPVEQDPSIFIQEEDYMVFIDYYEPLRPAERHLDTANLFYTKDSPIQDIGNGVGRFTRTWSVLPGLDATGKKLSYVRSEYESYVMTVPGIDTDQDAFTPYSVTSAVLSGGNHVITTSPAHDIAVGKGAQIWYTVQDPISKQSYRRVAYKVALSGTSGTTLVVSEIKDINTISVAIAQRGNTYQPPYQKVVMSRVDYDYWLPGVNVDSVDEIPILDQFSITDNTTGARTEFLRETTTPSIDTFFGNIEDGDWLVVEGSILRRWTLNTSIYERATRYVKYQL